MEALSGGEPGSDGALPSRHDAFNTLALDLFALQFAHNAPYRRLGESRGHTPDTVEHCAQIPAVPASAFKELELSCLPAEERTIVFHSSGTTEQTPSRHFHNQESLEVYEASLWPWFRKCVLPEFRSPDAGSRAPGRRWRDLAPDTWQLTLLSPPPPRAPHSSLVHMFATVRREMSAPASSFVGEAEADGAWFLKFNETLSALRGAAGKNRPVVLLGTAFSFVHLLDFLAEHNLRLNLPPGSRAMETGGYKGRSRDLPQAELHSLITRHLGIPSTRIVCEYGMSELSSQAYGLQAGAPCALRHTSRLFQFPPWARAQIISAETGREVAEGETGLLRIFDLANVFSVMAIQTDDLAVRRGDGFELMGRAQPAEPRGCSLMSEDS